MNLFSNLFYTKDKLEVFDNHFYHVNLPRNKIEEVVHIEYKQETPTDTYFEKNVDEGKPDEKNVDEGKPDEKNVDESKLDEVIVESKPIECKLCESYRFQNKCLLALLALTSLFVFKRK